MFKNNSYESIIFNPENLKLFSTIGVKKTFKIGVSIIKQGSMEDSIYYLASGTVSVVQDNKLIKELSAPCVLGEMALFNQNLRTATVTAVSKCTTVKIESKKVWNLIIHNNSEAIRFIYSLGRLMSYRINEIEKELTNGGAEQDEQYKSILMLKKELLKDLSVKYHSIGEPGKIMVSSSKPVGTPEDLSVAYSPGVATPCLIINDNPDEAYNLTTKGNLVGIITNATAVLGLGKILPVASKPVMEGKAVLFKKFANVNAFDIEIDELDPDQFINIVSKLEPTFGGINLEDIRAPECFYIETELIKRMSIPVFHDDQHGTAIIVGAGLINALKLTNRKIESIRIVFCGVGAAGFTCAEYLIRLGVKKENIILVDEHGVVHINREMSDYLKPLACDTNMRCLEEAVNGADVFIGLSKGNILAPEMLLSMNNSPIVFALANPFPEIEYSLAKKTRKDVILATGRSDYPNQINNVMAFPYIFRGALDTRANKISTNMKIAATNAIIDITALSGISPDYIVPDPHNPELLKRIPLAVAKSVLEDGLSKFPFDLSNYKERLNELSEQLLRG
jgi:malate dehydrogenase (oxaloacetate-decarboxylating)(NADP+)